MCCNECRASELTAYPSERKNRRIGVNDVQCEKCKKIKPLREFRKRKGVRSKDCKSCEHVLCSACMQQKPNVHFSASCVEYYWNHQRSVVCRLCETKGCSKANATYYQCSGPCNQKWGHQKYDRTHLKNHKYHGRPLVCSRCTIDNTAREQRLAALMRTSKRAKCTCKNWLMHSEKCPLHIQRFGERPYPGCDVMSEADSTWLLKRQRKK